MFETRELLNIGFALDRSISFNEWLIQLSSEEDAAVKLENDLQELIALRDKVVALTDKSVADKTVEAPESDVYAISK